jgi:protein dithiol oxidoreductase (disulfide-forming)
MRTSPPTFSRRQLTVSLSALLLGAALPTMPALAQGGPAPIEGQQYRKLKSRVPTSAGDKKIEIVEFFWYGCPHCSALEPALEAWLKTAPADVSFKRVHVNFGTAAAPDKRTDTHQRLFFTLEAMGLGATQNAAVFNAIHGDRKPLNSRDSVIEWAKSRNLDIAKFTAVFDDGFTLSRKATAARTLQNSYEIDGVPTFAVDGQFITSPSIAGGESQFFSTMAFLLNTVRKNRGPSTPAPATKAEDKKPAKKVVKKAE